MAEAVSVRHLHPALHPGIGIPLKLKCCRVRMPRKNAEITLECSEFFQRTQFCVHIAAEICPAGRTLEERVAAEERVLTDEAESAGGVSR